MPYRNHKPRPIITEPSPERYIIPNKTPIFNLLIQMKNDNKSDYTINFTRKALAFLAKHASLTEPESVKHFIAQHKVSDGYKRNLCIAYNKFCKYYKIKWQKIYFFHTVILQKGEKYRLRFFHSSPSENYNGKPEKRLSCI